MTGNKVTGSSIIRVSVILCGVAAVLIGSYWLLAWLIGQAAAVRATITVKTNMTVSQILGGAALLLLGSGPNRTRRVLGTSAALIVLMVGGVSEHLVGWNLHIDEFLASEAPGAAATVSPNRIGPPGSLSLFLLGAGLICMRSRRQTLAPYLGLAVCAINLVPAVGFLYGIEQLFALPNLTGVAWPTVTALIALGSGLILARPENSFLSLLLRKDPGGMLLRRLLPAAIMVPLLFGYLRVWGERHGLYDVTTGTGILVIVLVLIFSAALWGYAVNLSRSVSAQRESAEALRQSEERFRLAQELSPDGFTI